MINIAFGKKRGHATTPRILAGVQKKSGKDYGVWKEDMPITSKTVTGVQVKLLENMFIRAKSGHIPVDLQGDQQVYHIIFGNRKFSIRSSLQEGNFVFGNFGSRNMFHVLTTPSVPGSCLNYSVFHGKALAFVGFILVFCAPILFSHRTHPEFHFTDGK